MCSQCASHVGIASIHDDSVLSVTCFSFRWHDEAPGTMASIWTHETQKTTRQDEGQQRHSVNQILLQPDMDLGKPSMILFRNNSRREDDMLLIQSINTSS